MGPRRALFPIGACRLCLFDNQARALPLFQSALVGTNVLIAELSQLLRRHAALRALRAAAVYDDLRILGQIRAAHLVPEGHSARAGDVLAREPLIG